MSVYTVARDDFTNIRRSYLVLGVVGVFAALCTLVFVAEKDVFEDPYRALFDVSFLVTLAFPIFIAPLTYLAIAGDRQSGAIKYALGLPNTRAQYALAKFGSRLSVALAAILLGTALGFVVAAATFANQPDLSRFLRFGAVTLLYAFSFTGLYVGVSAATRKRSRAMLGVFGLYFLLIPFWFGFFPVISLQTVLDAVTSLLGVSLSEQTEYTIAALSPANSYLVSTEIVYEGVLTSYDQIALNFAPERSGWFYRTLWYNVLVMVAWGVGGFLLGFLQFRRSELG